VQRHTPRAQRDGFTLQGTVPGKQQKAGIYGMKHRKSMGKTWKIHRKKHGKSMEKSMANQWNIPFL